MNSKDLREQTIALAKAAPELKRRIIRSMTWTDLLNTDAEFERWVHDGQIEPPGVSWRTWLIMAGRGFGKTRAGAEWIDRLARSRRGVRIALVGATLDEARRVMVEGVSGVLSVARRNRSRVKWEPSIGRLRWANGSEAQLFSGDNPEGLRGPEHDFAWCDPAARSPRRAGGRSAAGQRPSIEPHSRELSSRRRRSDWRLGRPRGRACRLHRRRLAVHNASGRAVRLCQAKRHLCHLRSERLGGRNRALVEAVG